MTRSFLDSAYPPNDAQLEAAKGAGYAGWNGYFAGPHILNGWARADFDRVKRHGLATLAYCSGWSSAAAMRAQSIAWGVRICLDVEGGIRALVHPDDTEYLKATLARPTARESHLFAASSWVQPWLTVAGAGVYGNYWVHPGLRAAFYVLAAYPTSGDPSHVSWATAYGPRPGLLCGWQWAGSHDFHGRTVDSNWFDDALAVYLGGAAPAPQPSPTPGGNDEMLYVSATRHAFTATLATFTAGSSYRDPAADALKVGGLAKGATFRVDGYVYSTSAVQSSDINPAAAGDQPGPDYVWWHATTGQWIPDAICDTSAVNNAPKPALPATEPLELYLLQLARAIAGGVSADEAKRIAGLVAGSTVDAALAQLQITRKTT